MSTKKPPSPRDKDFLKELEDRSGIRVSHCYQCGKCTAGCPMVPDMDYTPSQIMRLIQMNRRETALRSKTIWYCASCHTCSTRCPKDVEIAGTMDVLREIALEENKVHPKAKKILAFCKAFLDSVKKKGRLFEVGMVMGYKLGSKDFFADIGLAPKMFLKGKLKLRPHPVKGRDAIRKLFERSRGKE